MLREPLWLSFLDGVELEKVYEEGINPVQPLLRPRQHQARPNRCPRDSTDMANRGYVEGYKKAQPERKPTARQFRFTDFSKIYFLREVDVILRPDGSTRTVVTIRGAQGGYLDWNKAGVMLQTIVASKPQRFGLSLTGSKYPLRAYAEPDNPERTLVFVTKVWTGGWSENGQTIIKRTLEVRPGHRKHDKAANTNWLGSNEEIVNRRFELERGHELAGAPPPTAEPKKATENRPAPPALEGPPPLLAFSSHLQMIPIPTTVPNTIPAMTSTTLSITKRRAEKNAVLTSSSSRRRSGSPVESPTSARKTDLNAERKRFLETARRLYEMANDRLGPEMARSLELPALPSPFDHSSYRSWLRNAEKLVYSGESSRIRDYKY
ncbi:hypothetical protein BJ508DRAFT_410768 [Ascobolus immersus RN42]|uniref:Uncharacterized protein n=1 Tax=Ascobolus immersus RN42 TaxID=1160509 RepID=A0A3N4IM88_ASCIM|nr:hypothetical protein BJ508DRAFT_410768 [Ascobolus immersus RN42]